MMEIFFIFSQHRSGSRVLCSLLDSHPDIVCPHEVLNPGRGDKLNYIEVAERLNIENSKFIGLHGHFEYLSNEILNAPFPKLLLYRKDEIMGGIKQSLMGIRRVNGLFELHAPTAIWNSNLRINRNKEMRLHSTNSISYEKLTNNEEVTELPKGITKRLLSFVGAEYQTLATTVRKEPEMLPKNIEEIYAYA